MSKRSTAGSVGFDDLWIVENGGMYRANTAASFGGLRLRSAASQGDVLPLRRACRITEVAPTTSTLRKPSSPARVMPPSLTLPAVE
jgi:hypothetical protein